MAFMTVEFRVATPDDAGAVLAIYASYCTSSVVSFEIVAPTEQEVRERIERVTSTHPWIVAEINGEVSGYVYATQLRERAAYRWAVELAVYIAETGRRRGLARALYRTLFELLRAQGFYQAYASITLPNDASVGLHESLGFERFAVFPKVGYKCGSWHDVGWWMLQLQPWGEEPAEPLNFRDWRGSATVAQILARGTGLL